MSIIEQLSQTPVTGRIVTLDADGTDLPICVYRPNGAGPFPAVILCPGGPERGSFGSMEWLASALRAENIAAVTMNWRANSPHRDADDIRLAVDWLATNPHVDAARIGIMGQSRGGNAALRAAAGDPRLRAVATFGPIVDFLEQAEKMRGTPAFRAVVAWIGDPDAEPEVYAALQTDRMAGTISQPALLLHAAADERVPVSHSQRMHDALVETGHADVRLELMTGIGHYGERIGGGMGHDLLIGQLVPFFAEKLRG